MSLTKKTTQRTLVESDSIRVTRHASKLLKQPVETGQASETERKREDETNAKPSASEQTITKKKKKELMLAGTRAKQLQEGTRGRDEIDYSTTDFAGFLARDIERALSKPQSTITVEEDQAKKFLRNASVRFLGQRKDEEPPPKARRLVSRKESVFHNDMNKPTQYTFSKTAQDTTTAQLTTRSGFTIGVLAAIGGGVGGQATLGAGGAYSREKEFMEQTSCTSGKEMQAQVEVSESTSVIAEESTYDAVYDADCDFDIIIPESYKIRCSDERGYLNIEAGKLKTSDDPEDIVRKSFLRPRGERYVHLLRSYKCKIVTTEHELRIIETDKKTESVGNKRQRDSGGNEPNTGSAN